jgi:hypothetical protein
MNEHDRVVRASVFELFVAGSQQVTGSEIADSTGMAFDAIVQSLNRLAHAHRLVLGDDRERVVMAHPFSGVPTGYRAEIGERSWQANCAWDAFGILALLGDGKVVANPFGPSDSEWTVVDGGVEPNGVVHFMVPAARFWDDIEFTWRTIHCFRSEAELDGWLSETGNSYGASVTVQTAYDLAILWYRKRMDTDWNPPSAAEAEAVFRRFGLTGDFWKLS